MALKIDHIIPVAQGGSDDDGNLAPACDDCNFGKRDRVYSHLVQRVDVSVRENARRRRVEFLPWLRRQRGRNDIVGDFADDEEKWPLVEPYSFPDLSKQLRNKHASREARNAAWHAWREFQRNGKPTRAVAKMQAEFRAALERAMQPGSGTNFYTKQGIYSEDTLITYEDKSKRRLDDKKRAAKTKKKVTKKRVKRSPRTT